MLRSLEDIELNAGETVFSQYTSGDYFYIIKQGEVRIEMDAFGPQKGQHVELGAGGYFGDEALIADSPRNASVTMVTEGVLGRLTREAFNEIVKNSLVNPISIDQIGKMIPADYECIDVRLSVERRLAKADNARNIPISHLRQSLDHLEKKTTYIVGPESDRRSELGAYLLRQAGFDAYCLA